MYKKLLMSIFLYSISAISIANQYIMPPTTGTNGYVPVMSDQQTEQCVEIYNKANWLKDTINQTYVNQYSSEEVNQYNNNIIQLNQWTSWFNQNCAGKQSYSACKAAQELNKKEGRPTQSCN